MSGFFVNARTWGKNILVRRVDAQGIRRVEKVPFKPTLYSLSQAKKTKFVSMFEQPLETQKFADINDAKDFIKRYKDVANFPIFGNPAFEYQYISETNPGVIEYDVDKIKAVTWDIETTVEEGFPNYFNPIEKVQLISVRDKVSKTIVSFGLKPFAPAPNGITSGYDVTYIHCRDEETLFEKFLRHHEADYPDVITGWNVDGFDIPYTICRMTRILGEDAFKRLSPFGIVRSQEKDVMGKPVLKFDIYGVAVLDYLELYKKFTYTKQENYKLDHIAFIELGKNKLDHEYASFKEFYTNDWNRFVEYNIMDVVLVDELEEKMKLIELAYSIAYMAKINIDEVYSPVKMWETIIYNHMLDKGIVIPLKTQSEEFSTGIEGAFVKPPVPGKYKWIASFDLASLYPHIIMALNMCPSTIHHTMVDITVDKMLAGDKSFVKEGFSLAPNGSMYDMSIKGFMPALMSFYYNQRKIEKKKMLAMKSELEAHRRDWTPAQIRMQDNKIAASNNLQMALKIALNSAYGAMANKHFLFFDRRIAEGITMCGQLIIQNSSNSMNGFMNKLLSTDKDYVIAADTDSCYVHMEAFVNKIYPGRTTDETVDFLVKACDDKIAKVLNDSCDRLSISLNWNPGLINFKREAISSVGFWTAKKRYALYVHDNEGVRYAEPDLKVMGMDVVRSTTPQMIKGPLTECIKLILLKEESDLQQFVTDTEAVFLDSTIEAISLPTGVNNLAKYSSSETLYKKGAPMHVRAALLYNNQLEKHGLDKVREKIQEGGKIRYLFLKEPNMLREDVIGFVDNLPPEFNLARYVDYNRHWERSFIKPLKKMTDAVGWNWKEEASLSDLFE